MLSIFVSFVSFFTWSFKVAFDMELKCLEDNNSVVPNCLFKCPEGYEESCIDPLLYRPLYKY